MEIEDRDQVFRQGEGRRFREVPQKRFGEGICKETILNHGERARLKWGSALMQSKSFPCRAEAHRAKAGLYLAVAPAKAGLYLAVAPAKAGFYLAVAPAKAGLFLRNFGLGNGSLFLRTCSNLLKRLTV
jgi:hypothetical protein